MVSYRYSGLAGILLVILVVGIGTAGPGSLFTTNATCTEVNINDYTNKEDVYIRGTNFPAGYYYVKVTSPGGGLLGTSVGSSCWTPVHSNGVQFDQCYQLWSIVTKASDATMGFDDTTNPDGNYKVWASSSSGFPPSDSKTDNFNVIAPATGILNVLKFYDANANGLDDDLQYILGWKVNISNTSVWFDRYTNVTETLVPGMYSVEEYEPVEDHWKNTTPSSVEISLDAGDEVTVIFGNLCLGGGGGHTIGYWGNKNGGALIGSDDLTLLSGLNLTNATGSDFDPSDFAALDAWLQDADAVNMAYMLSAQMAAMELNVFNGFVDGNTIIYAPGTNSANLLGYAPVNAVMTEADAALGADSWTPAGDPNRSHQEALKDALDDANNNLNFVQPLPCSFSFI